MSIAAASCWFSALSSRGGAASSNSTSNRLRCASCRPHSFSKASEDPNYNPMRGKARKSDRKSVIENEADIQKFRRSPRGEYPASNAGGRSTQNTTGRSQATSFKSFGVQKKENKGHMVDSVEQQVETGNLPDADFLSAVVKVYCTHTAPDYSLPWQKQRQYTSTGSAFMIGEGKLLTNAHCVEHDTQVKVKRRGDDTKYVAKVLARGVECDLALLTVESKEFWEGAEPLHLGNLPNLQNGVTVVGYPLGGETISVSKGVVSRIEVTSYAHGSSELLGIQIDAAINPGNSGGPAFNEQGECIGVAFQVYRSDDVENIGYVIPTTVVSHFLQDYERNGKYTGFPCLGVLLQKLENRALRACLNVPSNEGVLVRKVEPTAPASHVLKEGDVIVSFDNVRVGCEGTVPFRSTERIAFRYLISQKFTGDEAELGIIRGGQLMKVQVVLNPRVHLVPYHIEGDQPSYFIIAGLVFTSLSEPLIDEECADSIGLKLLAKARYSMPKFKGEQIVILSQVLANEENIGYEEMSNEQVLKLNGTWIRNIHHMAHLVDTCKEKYLIFEFEENFLVVLERESALAASASILKSSGIPFERSPDLMEPYLDSVGQNEAVDHREFGESPVSNSEFGYDGLLWA
ncbi:DEGP protease 2 [Perilla frutescens var. hirtella]|uniref:DEGP protease 2 n=1 Tax=Perilla frutescens var. hirtella TaxID=608512 RepID=A0AAD4J6R1_PERFH|nr:DEGP protease 2 [Perilla frutescens var. hirtella]KAH6806802.1 DEGP protease 2 [Perilla frutescens var. frutescens]KAH6827610.1 DEGP protease 2 [Perilla frutescens var. hirtella]